MVEASGSYLDEATGQTKSVPASAPLRAALPNVTGTVSLPVTPLTELAVRQAGTLTVQNINVITATGSAVNSYIDGNYIPATTASPATLTIGLISSTTLSTGDVIDLNFDLAPGSTSPLVTEFIISSSKLAATGGTVVSGASLVLR